MTSTQYNAKRIHSKNGYQSDSVESESDVAFAFARSAWYWYKSIQSYKVTLLSLSLSFGLNTPLHECNYRYENVEKVSV